MENDEFVDEDDDDDNDFDSEDEDEPITLGFLEKPKNPLNLSRHFFPSKAGGLPAWLDPLNIPSGKSSVCDFCGDPLHFVLQVYAPVVEKESTFHRMLFVFMCPSMTCLLRDQHKQWKRNPEKPSRSVKVFRCRLPHINPFYSSECPKYDGSDKPTGTGGSVVVSPIHLPVVWMIALSFSHLVKCTLGIPVERMMIETDSPYCKIKNTHAGIGFVNLRDLLRRKRSMIKSASSKAAMNHVQLGKFSRWLLAVKASMTWVTSVEHCTTIPGCFSRMTWILQLMLF